MAAKAKTARSRPAAPAAVQERRFWLFKSEPDTFSWDMLKAVGAKGEPWTGVRNYQARNNMRAMRPGEQGFFYHSNTGREIVGVLEVCRSVHPDPTDGSGIWDCVDVVAVSGMPHPVSLAAIKANPKLKTMALVTAARLSVQPVTAEEWAEICVMGGLGGTAVAALPVSGLPGPGGSAG